MIKVFEELNLKKKEHVTYSESYAVRFWIQKSNGYWEQREQVYFATSKGRHDAVVDRWESDHAKFNVRLICCEYQ